MAAGARASSTPAGYTASIESEIAMIGRREGRIEGATLLEGVSSRARWSTDGVFEQHITGSRIFPNSIPLSKLAYVRIGWVAPTLLGERLQVIVRTGLRETDYGQSLVGPLAPEVAISPLASDREKYYRYSGGETVERTLDGVASRVIAIEVTPILTQSREETLFEGEMELDPRSLALVRLFGRFIIVSKSDGGGLIDLRPDVVLVDLLNQRLSDGTWAPRVQRFEIQTSSSLAEGSGAIRRVISRFHLVEPMPRREAISASTSGYVLTSATSDSLRAFNGWFASAGYAAEHVNAGDFNRFRPDKLRPTGRPLLLIQGSHRADFIRLNKVEGVFTGAAATLRMRDKLPGISFVATGGYAWSEKTVRGGAGIDWQMRRWLWELSGGRVLDVTNDFRNQFDNPSTAGLVGRDPWDYVEREGVQLFGTRAIRDARGSAIRVEGAYVSDNAVSKHRDKSLVGLRFKENRTAAEGTYFRGRAMFDWNPDVSPLFALDGVGFKFDFEAGAGDIYYKRVEARLVARKSFKRVFFVARLHGGMLFSSAPPPQQLFELGGAVGLPGYEYKEFAGNRAALFRMRLTYPFSFLDSPINLGKGVVLPSLAPAISIGYQTGVAHASNQAARDAVRALGNFENNDGTVPVDGNGDPLPASSSISSPKGSVDIRIGFFGDALAIGFARAIQRGRSTKFIFALGRQF